MKNILILISISIFMLSAWSCSKKEDSKPAAQKQTLPSGPIVDITAGQGAPAPKTVFQVMIPQEIRDQWGSVIIIVEDKKENSKQEFTVNTNGEFKIPDSNLTVKVGPFLPDFKMSAQTITTASAEPNNPSVGVAIIQDGSKIFPATGEWGWLYSKFPTIHSFQHERFGLVLKEGIKK